MMKHPRSPKTNTLKETKGKRVEHKQIETRGSQPGVHVPLGVHLPGVHVPLGYKYPWGYICLSEGVHLRLAIEGENIFTCCLFSNLYTYITYIVFKSHYMYTVKCICEKS